MQSGLKASGKLHASGLGAKTRRRSSVVILRNPCDAVFANCLIAYSGRLAQAGMKRTGQNDRLIHMFTIAIIISFTYQPVKRIIPVTRQQAGHSRQFHGVRLIMVGDATQNLPLAGPGCFPRPREISATAGPAYGSRGLSPQPRSAVTTASTAFQMFTDRDHC